MTPLQVQLDRIRRRAWLVIVVTAIAVGGALASALGAATSFTGSSTLSTSTLNRSPDQDSFLAQGYAEYFNQPSYQDVLRTEAGIPADVGLNARLAATSPILYVEAVAGDPETAVDASTRAAEVFAENINDGVRSSGVWTTAALRNEMFALRPKLADPAVPADERALLVEELGSLQSRITDIQTTRTNELKSLQPQAGVSSSTPDPVREGLIGLVGGLVLGAALALALAVVENRLVTPQDVRERLGRKTLAVVRGRGTAREAQLKALAHAVGRTAGGGSTVLAVVGARPGPGPAQVAAGIARGRAMQGVRTLLVRADLSGAPAGEPDGGGLAEFLLEPAGKLADQVRPGGWPDVQLVPAGTLGEHDPFGLLTPDRVGQLVAQARTAAELVVLDAPAATAPESHVLCAAANRTILVVEEGVTRAAAAAEACRALEQAGANILGVVVIRPLRRRAAARLEAARSTTPALTPGPAGAPSGVEIGA